MSKMTNNNHDIVTSDPVILTVQLSFNDKPAVIPVATQVKALLQSSSAIDRNPIVCSSAETGANWALGIIAIKFLTANIPAPGTYTLEVQVQGVATWFAEGVLVRAGQII